MLTTSLKEGIKQELLAAGNMRECLDISKDIMTFTRDITTDRLNELFNAQYPELRPDPEGEDFE